MMLWVCYGFVMGFVIYKLLKINSLCNVTEVMVKTFLYMKQNKSSVKCHIHVIVRICIYIFNNMITKWLFCHKLLQSTYLHHNIFNNISIT